MPEFTLHPRLTTDTVFVADWELSRVHLMDDARYPWLVLVPRRVDVIELFDLSQADQALLMEEVACASRCLKALGGVTKINVGALGNLVPQLHVHVVARHPGDPAWPGPVWGHSPAVPYQAAARDALIATILGEC
jgi:diadenosine tetraphosphate (Ap4A) HIT family hydrolase